MKRVGRPPFNLITQGSIPTPVTLVEAPSLPSGIRLIGLRKSFPKPATVDPGRVRLSQQYLEIINSGGDNRVRLSQQYLEAIHAGDNNAGDPYWQNVLVCADFDAADQSTTYTEKSLYKRLLTTNGSPLTSIISATHAENGPTSLLSHNTTSSSFPSSTDYNSISATNASPYTIEYSIYQTDTASNYDVYDSRNGSNGVLIRHNGGANAIQFFWNPGTGLLSNSFPVTFVANAFTKYAITKDSSGTIRAFQNGVLLSGTVTPADSHIATGASNLWINVSGAGQDSWVDNVRLTKAVCRYTANYTPTTAKFLTNSEMNQVRLSDQYLEIIHSFGSLPPGNSGGAPGHNKPPPAVVKWMAFIERERRHRNRHTGRFSNPNVLVYSKAYLPPNPIPIRQIDVVKTVRIA